MKVTKCDKKGEQLEADTDVPMFLAHKTAPICPCVLAKV